MAVPNTTTFSLQDVINELGITSNKSLSNCFTLAIDGLFDSSYKQSKTELDDFRNYNAGLTLVQFQMTSQKYFTNLDVNCLNNTYTTYWHDGTGLDPTVGDTIYEDSAGTTLHDGRFFGSNGFRKTSNSQLIIQVGINGNVTTTSSRCQP